MVSAMRRIPYGADAAVRKRQDLERTQKEQAAARGLAASQIGSGGTLKVDGSLQVTGSITVPGTLSSAGAISAGTTVTAGGDVNAGGNVNAPSGTLVSAYARSHSVVVSYVAAYIDGSGNFLSTPSSLRMKRDIRTATWTREQRDKIRTVFYRLRAAYILADMQGEDLSTVETLAGVIGEELLAAGLPEFVVLDEKRRVFTVRYELLALIAIDGLQQAEARQDETDREVRDLRQEVADLRALIERR